MLGCSLTGLTRHWYGSSDNLGPEQRDTTRRCTRLTTSQGDGKIDQENVVPVQVFPIASVTVSDPLPTPSIPLAVAPNIPATNATPVSDADPPKVARRSQAGPANNWGM
jgi:hypothetical protein